MFSKFTHLVVCVRISFLFKPEYFSIVFIVHIFFTSSYIGGHCCFYLLTIVNNDAVKMGVQITVSAPAFTSLCI